MKKIITISIAAMYFLYLAGCASGGKDASEEPVAKEQRSSSKNSNSSKNSAEKENLDSAVRRNFTLSKTNTSLTSQQYSSDKAMRVAEKINLDNNNDLPDLEKRLSAQILGHQDLGSIWQTLSRVGYLYAKKNVKKDIPESIPLEMAAAAIINNDYTLAEYFLTPLYRSKDPQIKAAALNLYGLILAEEDKIPEAVAQWTLALKVNSSYEPAILNLGITAIKYGDFVTAKRTLGHMLSDWYVKSALLIADRHTGNPGEAKSKCDYLLKDHRKNKLITFNCGLVYFQDEGNFKRAKELLSESAAEVGGAPSWTEKAYKVIEKIDEQEMKAAMKKEEAVLNKEMKEKEKK